MIRQTDIIISDIVQPASKKWTGEVLSINNDGTATVLQILDKNGVFMSKPKVNNFYLFLLIKTTTPIPYM